MITRIDHIGIAVRSLAEATRFYEEALGIRAGRTEEVPSQQVRTTFLEIGEVHLELLEPTSPESPIARFLEKRGEGIHHIAYATDDVGHQLERARDAGVRLLNEVPVPGAGGKLVAFLHPKSTFGVLTEFCAPAPAAAADHQAVAESTA